jgi:hypothetical protein
MKKILWVAILVFSACNGKESGYRPAGDALDAGREYINACLQGDFSKAAFYTVPDEKNKQVLTTLEKSYREKDREGRQQLRTASINISEVKEMADSGAEIHYNNSFDKEPHTLQVTRQNNSWLVDLSKK